MSKPKLFIPILASIGLTILFIFITNLGIKLFYPEPEYTNYDCIILQDGSCEGKDCVNNTCPVMDYTAYQEKLNTYNQRVYFLYAIQGIISIAIGLFMPFLISQITGIATGFILIIIGMTRNYESTLTIFITSIILVGLIIFMLYWFNRKKK